MNWMLALCSFILGVVGKYADLLNEHGLKQPFKGCSILSGIIWGLSGIGMVYFSPLGGLTYVAHVLYWFWRVKLEYSNHAIAGVMMLLGAFFIRGTFFQEHRWDLFLVFLSYLFSGYIQTYFKERFISTRPFWRLRFRIYLIPIVYSLYTQNWDPIIATGFGMIGCEWITLTYRDYWEDKRHQKQAS